MRKKRFSRAGKFRRQALLPEFLCQRRQPSTKVLRDLRLNSKLLDRTKLSDKAMQLYYQDLLAMFWGSSTARTKADGQPRRIPVGTQLVRKSCADYVEALERVLYFMFQLNLASFGPAATLAGGGPPKTLVLVQDQGGCGYALSWYLLYHAKLRMVVFHDIFHREWNDVRGGLKSAGLWWAVLLSTVVLNLNYGPWESQSWWCKLCEMGAHFWETRQPGDPLFEALYENICFDKGQEPLGTTEHRRALFDSLQTDLLFETAQRGPLAHCAVQALVCMPACVGTFSSDCCGEPRCLPQAMWDARRSGQGTW